MKEIFSENGYLSRIIPSFEFREEQIQMADFILERLYDSENGIIEAGTGTGKTLAYLIPAVLYAMDQDKKIAISTETKTLQKQLVDKDLPIVQEVIRQHYNMEFSFSLCLGSSNYPCRKRFEAALKAGKLHPGELKKLKPVSDLFGKKKLFTHFDVTVPGYLWNEINREGDSCDSYKCPFAGVCSYQLARKEWSQSHLLVMNHYLFFTNIASGKTYLPPCDIVIFDEAHSLEDIAAAQIGFNIGYREILEIINLFYNDKKYNIVNSIEDESTRLKWITAIKKITPEISDFFEGLRTLVPAEKNYIRLKEPLPSGDIPAELLKNFMLLMAEAEGIFDEEHPRRIEFDIARGKLFSYLENLSSFVHQKNENYVYWIDREADTMLGDLFLRGQPVDISELFQREILMCYDSSMFVSATLSIGGDFSYIVSRLGIENFKALSLQSSFDYQSQVVLYVARDIGDPGQETYNTQAATDAAEIINHLQGNCLMLFTSFKTLRDIKNILSGMIDYPVYSQDVLTPTDAFERYVGDTNSVLMGTHSFWQGIDLPGDLVRGVMLMKLPFAVPDSPPVEAKMERLVALGKNPFSALQVPEAVIRFKQGFGRLIRSSSDRGIVAVLDSRIVNKAYGKIFLKAIPECRIVHSLAELKDAYPLLRC
jgi:ATP-dependent DNA helicase DinG